ncbi:MAG: DUF6288 domain-containing protein [Lentisphaeria bacterium]|nr:DUF6288 domain-containing protein [Lentisphaeria bacterium]
MKKLIITAMCVCLAVTAIADDTDIPGTNGVPDLTKGGELTRINERWIGPLGVQCGFWRPRGQKQEDVRQFLVVEIDKGSPADGVLAVGDVILGADGTGAAKVPLFKGADWPMSLFGDPIAEAEARDPAVLKLLVWRPSSAKAMENKPAQRGGPGLDDVGAIDDVDAGGGNALGDWGAKPKKADAEETAKGETMAVTVTLEYLGRYSDTAPYNCEKSKNILRKGIRKLYKDNQPDKAGLAMLCLLAADDPTNPHNDKYQARAREWAHQLEFGGGPWFSGPKLIALSEYYMKTKDESIFPLLVKQAEYHARGVSWFGTTGHKFADPRDDGSPRGRMSGYGPIGACGVRGLLGLSLARRAGVDSPIVEAANRDQRIFFGHYAFKGSPSYGEFLYSFGGAPGDNNAKCAMTALALGMEDNQEKKAKYFTKMSTLSTASDRVYAHGGSFFAQVWNPIGAAQGGVKAANLHFKQNQWHFDLKRRWNHRRIYDGSGNDYKDFSWDATGLLFYALPLKQLYVTGRGQKESLTLSDAEFDDLVNAKNYDAEKVSTSELIADLSSFDTLRRSAISDEIANRIKAKPDDPESAALIDQLIALASDNTASAHGRAGACRALYASKIKAQGPLAELKNAEIARAMLALQKAPDPFIWYAGLKVLQELPTPAVKPYVNDILDAAVTHARPTFPLTDDDPLQASQVKISQLLFDKMLNNNLGGVDRKKLISAVSVLLSQPHANGRNFAAKGLAMVSPEEVMELAEVAVDNVIHRPPANAMGGAGALVKSQSVLAEHLFEEALPLSFKYAPGEALKNKIHQKYGQAAFTMHSVDDLMRILADQMLASAALDANEVIDEMRKAPAPQTLRKLKVINSVKAAQPALTLPANQTELVTDARNYAFPETDTTYTWRKVYGAGKVIFTPNGSGKSKTTTVSFTDQKPGKYRFEVTMTDVLGYTKVSDTVDVILYDTKGKLPANRPPQATSQTLATAPGLPTRVTLNGTDPDGDDLGFIVTKKPAHGKLIGVGGTLTYVADYGDPSLATETAKPVAVKGPSLDDMGDTGSDTLNDWGGLAKGYEGSNWTDSFTFEVIDGQGETATGNIQFKVSDQNVGVAVYEGFDYPTGALHNQQGGSSFGFSGPWINSRGSDDGYLVVGKDSEGNASLSYPTLPSTGGQFVKGQGHTACSRGLDRQLLKDLKMLEPGGEMWFSFFFSEMKSRHVKFSAGETDTLLGVYVQEKNAQSGVFAVIDKQMDESSRNAWSRTAGRRFPEGPSMVVCRCIWGQTDKEPDTVEVYRVFNAKGYGIVIPQEPVSTVKGIIPQEMINAIVLNMSVEAPLDEIRVGPTMNSVLLGTQPLND